MLNSVSEQWGQSKNIVLDLGYTSKFEHIKETFFEIPPDIQTALQGKRQSAICILEEIKTIHRVQVLRNLTARQKSGNFRQTDQPEQNIPLYILQKTGAAEGNK